jgi:hypothetical protein
MTLALPPPHDLEAEEVVLSAVLWGDVRPSALRLDPRWFWPPDHQWLWALLLTYEEMGLLPLGQESRAMFARGQWWSFRGPDLSLLIASMSLPDEPDPRERRAPQVRWVPEHARRRLLQLMGRCPGRHNGSRWMTIGDYAALVRRRWRDRQLCRGMQLIDAALRLGEPVPEKASRWVARELGGAGAGWRGSWVARELGGRG